MTTITLRIVDGCDRGRIYSDLNLDAPVTIGREEGNRIQLNDERVSRFHVKIQDDSDRIVLTDLESTNGTKVNGEEIQLRILRVGDMITVGRSTLLLGSRDEIAERLAQMRTQLSGEQTLDPSEYEPDGSAFDFELNWREDNDLQATMHVLQPPDIPDGLTPGQAAQLSEMLEYLHVRIRNLLNSVHTEAGAERIDLSFRAWQNLLDVQARLAEYLREIGEPGRDD